MKKILSCLCCLLGLLVLAVLIPSSAFAFNTNEIITYGIPQIEKGVIQASTSFCNSPAFENILSIVVAVGAMYSIIFFGFYKKDWSRTLWYFAYVTFVYSIFIGVKVNVTVINKYPPNETYTVNNVPWGLGYLASVYTNFSDQITEKFDTLFSLPDSFKYSQYGITHSMRVVQSSILSAQPTSQYLIKNVQSYFEDCSIDTDYINGVKNWDNFWWADDVLVEIKHDSFMDPFPTFIYESSGGNWTGSEKTCADAYNTIVSQFNTDYAPIVKKINLDLYGTETPPGATFATQYDEVNSLWGFASQNAATTVRNASVMYAMDAVFDAAAINAGVDPTINSFSRAAAEAQQRTVQQTQGWLSAKNLPLMRGVFEMILYGCFGIIFIMIITPWGPMLSVVNYAATVNATNAFAKAGYNAVTGAGTGTSIAGMMNLIDVSADQQAIVAGYIGAVPLIALVIITGASAYGFTQMAQRTEGAATGAATSSGSQAAMGEIRMGNVSMNTEDIKMKQQAGWSRQTEGVDWKSTRAGEDIRVGKSERRGDDIETGDKGINYGLHDIGGRKIMGQVTTLGKDYQSVNGTDLDTGQHIRGIFNPTTNKWAVVDAEKGNRTQFPGGENQFNDEKELVSSHLHNIAPSITHAKRDALLNSATHDLSTNRSVTEAFIAGQDFHKAFGVDKQFSEDISKSTTDRVLKQVMDSSDFSDTTRSDLSRMMSAGFAPNISGVGGGYRIEGNRADGKQMSIVLSESESRSLDNSITNSLRDTLTETASKKGGLDYLKNLSFATSSNDAYSKINTAQNESSVSQQEQINLSTQLVRHIGDSMFEGENDPVKRYNAAGEFINRSMLDPEGAKIVNQKLNEVAEKYYKDLKPTDSVTSAAQDKLGTAKELKAEGIKAEEQVREKIAGVEAKVEQDPRKGITMPDEKAFTATYTYRKEELKTKQNEIKDESLSKKIGDEVTKQFSGNPAAKEKFQQEIERGKTLIEAQSKAVKDVFNPEKPKL